jgi:hypothetical protein
LCLCFGKDWRVGYSCMCMRVGFVGQRKLVVFVLVLVMPAFAESGMERCMVGELEGRILRCAFSSLWYFGRDSNRLENQFDSDSKENEE